MSAAWKAVCVRFYIRADGTLLTQDCPVVLLSCVSGLLRRMGAAQAATPAKKDAKPHTIQPSHTMGIVSIPPRPTLGAPLPPKR